MSTDRTIWNKYEKCKSYADKKGILDKATKHWNMYTCNQWYDPENSNGAKNLPMENFIKPTVKYKVNTIAQNTAIALFSDLEGNYTKACDNLSTLFNISWEKSKMEKVKRKCLSHAAIQGDSYLYWFSGDTREQPQLILNTQMFLGDENICEIQEQPYIIIKERLSLDVIRKRAKEREVETEDIKKIVADSDATDQLLNKEEVDDKVTSLLYFEKKRNKKGVDEIWVARATESLVYEKLHKIVPHKDGEEFGSALSLYPIVSMVWEEIPNDARGVGEVAQLINNQVELNKTLARRSAAIKLTSYPRMAADMSMLSNEEDLNKVGAILKFNGANSQSIESMISYLSPATQSQDAKIFSDELRETSKDLTGASDSALGDIDLSRVASTALTMIRDQQKVPLNEQISMFTDFVENVALLYYDIWKTYFPEGIHLDGKDNAENTEEIEPPQAMPQAQMEQGQQMPPEMQQQVMPQQMPPAQEEEPIGSIDVTREELDNILPNVRIDVSEDTTMNRLAEEQEVSNLFNNNKITFEEFVELMPAHSTLPKDKLRILLRKREKKAAAQQAAMQKAQMAMQQAQMQQQGATGNEVQDGEINNNVEEELPAQDMSGSGSVQQIQAQMAQQ